MSGHTCGVQKCHTRQAPGILQRGGEQDLDGQDKGGDSMRQLTRERTEHKQLCGAVCGVNRHTLYGVVCGVNGRPCVVLQCE